VGNLGPVHCDHAICVLELDVQVALLELDDFAGNAVAIGELENVLLLSRRAHHSQNEQQRQRGEVTGKQRAMMDVRGFAFFHLE
jgi:hypothetical protein